MDTLRASGIAHLVNAVFAILAWSLLLPLPLELAVWTVTAGVLVVLAARRELPIAMRACNWLVALGLGVGVGSWAFVLLRYSPSDPVINITGVLAPGAAAVVSLVAVMWWALSATRRR